MVGFQVINGQPLFIVNADGFHLSALPSVFSPEVFFSRWQNGAIENLPSKPTDSDGPNELRYRAASLKLTAEWWRMDSGQ